MKFVDKMRQSSLLVVACSLMFGVSDVHALMRGDMEVYGLGESFTWREFDDAGGQLLKESGPRFGAGFAYAHEFPDHMTLKPRVELNGGSVDYDGQAKTVPPAAVSTTTTYFGIKAELDLGGRIRPSQGTVLEPFGGIGIRAWTRYVEDSISADGSFVDDYTENWTTMYGRLGVRGEQSLGEMLEPGNKPSLFAEAGVKLPHLMISFFYDSMRFKRSPSVVVYDSYLGAYVSKYQPRSDADMFGLRIGGSF